MQFDMMIIGGGPAGVSAALRARELGATVALIERGQMGGTCTNDGCVPTRVLAKTARLVRDARQFQTYGLLAEPPQLDFTRVLARVRQVVTQIHEKKQVIDHLAQAGVTVFADVGTAHFVDPHTLALADGTTLQAKNFIICAGGHARRLEFPGSEHTLTHSDVWSLPALPRSVVVVGGAATGCQLASILSDFGVEVWLLDTAARILPAEDELVSQTMTRRFQLQGIRVIPGIEAIKAIVPDAKFGLRLHYTQHGEERNIPIASVIMAVGWVGNAEQLNLAAAQVETERSYIKVNDALQTSAPHIYAAGDITGRMMLVQTGSQDAHVAAENAILGVAQQRRSEIVPHGGFTDPEYGSVGLTEQQARDLSDCIVAEVPYTDLDRAVVDGRTEGFCKLIVDRETHQILGGHVVGEQAVEVVQLLAAGIAAGLRVEQLADLELAYPTFTAIVGSAARQIVRELNLQPAVHGWRGLRPIRILPEEEEIQDAA